MKKAFLKSAFLLLTGGVAGQCLALGRNILIARSLGTESYGIGSALLVGVSLIEMTTDLSTEKVLVQAREGGDRRFLAAAQTLLVLRSVIVALILILLAPAIAWLLEFPEHVALFRWLAVLPLIQGWRNLELTQRQRIGEFRPFVVNGLCAQVIATAAAIPLVIYLKEPITVVLASGIAALATVVGSHLLARRRFCLAWCRRHFGTMIRFGVPLILNGGILFLSLQGDRIVVLRGFGPVGFAIISVALALIAVPVNLTAKILGDLLLPRFSELHGSSSDFVSAARAALMIYSFIGAFAAMGFVIFGPYVMKVYGPEYSSAVEFLPLLGLAASIRLVRAAQAMLGFSAGRTGIAPVTGLARLLGLLGSIAVVEAGGSIADIAVAMICGEMCSFIAGAIYLRVKLGLGAGAGVVGILMMLACFGLAKLTEAWDIKLQIALIVTIGFLFLSRAWMMYKHFQKRWVENRSFVGYEVSPEALN